MGGTVAPLLTASYYPRKDNYTMLDVQNIVPLALGIGCYLHRLVGQANVAVTYHPTVYMSNQKVAILMSRVRVNPASVIGTGH